MPRLRPGQRRALRHLGRPLGAGAAQAEEARRLTPGRLTDIPTDLPPPSRGSGTGPTVLAVIVADGAARSALITALTESTRPPTAALVIATPGADIAAELARLAEAGIPATVRREPSVPDLRRVAESLVSGDSGASVETLLWLLPGGTVPEPGALGALVAEWQRSPSVGVIGPKHLEPDADNIQALAIHATRAGRIVAEPRPGTPDMGQLDTATDALAVPAAGVLIETALLRDLGGWSPRLVDLAADLDLGWRAQSLGRRVIVAPAAQLRTEDGVAVTVAETAARRRDARTVVLARTPWWLRVPLALWVLLSTVVTALALLLAKRPRSAAAELAQITALMPWKGWARPHQGPAPEQVRSRDLRTLFVPGRRIVGSALDSVHDALIPPRPPASDAAHDLTPRTILGRVLAHPLVLVVGVIAAAVVAASRTLGWSLWQGISTGLAGGEVVDAQASASAVWASWVDGWRGPGLGAPGSGAPYLGLVAPLAWLAEHLPLIPAPASSAGSVVFMLLMAGLPLSAVSAYLAAAVLTDARWPRALAAVVWATNPVSVRALAEGRLGAVLATVLIPLVGAGLWLIASRRGTVTSGFATGLALAILATVAPAAALGPVAVLSLLVIALRRARVRAALALLTAAGLLWPWLLDVIDVPALLLAGPGLVQWSGDSLDGWWPMAAGAVPMVVLGALALLAPRPLRDVRTALVAAVLACVVATMTAARTGAWAPVLALLGYAVLVASALLLLRHHRLARAAQWAIGVSAVVSIATMVTLGLGSSLRARTEWRPSVGVDQSLRFFSTRTLAVTVDGDRAAYRLVGKEVGDLVRSLPTSTPADDAIAGAVANLLAGEPSGRDLLSRAAVDVIAVRGRATERLIDRLDAVEGLSRIGTVGEWTSWRFAPGGAEAATVAPPRLRVVTPESTVAVPATRQSAATDTTVTLRADGVLVVAMPPEWAAHAQVRVDGATVTALPHRPEPTYPISAGTHRIDIDVVNSHGWPRLLSLAWLVVVIFLALPFGRRDLRLRGRRR